MTNLESLNNVQLQDLINAAKARLTALQSEASSKNEEALVKAILDLKEGLGIDPADWYAPDRLYISTIPGVKNIRFQGPDEVLVKITDRRGKLLPEKVVIDTNVYTITWIRSRYYQEDLREIGTEL